MWNGTPRGFLCLMKRGGFTLVETIMAVMLTALAVLLVVNSMVSSSRFARNVNNNVSSSIQCRKGLEMITSDIRAAESIMVQFPTWSGTYRSNTTDTIVMRIPNGGLVTSPNYNVIVYQWTAATGAKAPGVVKRYIGTMNGGAETAPVLDREVAFGVTCLFEYWAVQAELANGTQSAWALPPGSIAGSENPQAIVAGADRVAAGTAAFAGGTATFTPRPAAGSQMTFLYPINVTSSPGGQLSYTGSVKVSLTPTYEDRNANSTITNKTQPVTTMVVLRNRPAL